MKPLNQIGPANQFWALGSIVKLEAFLQFCSRVPPWTVKSEVLNLHGDGN